jgi:hypothetical protein
MEPFALHENQYKTNVVQEIHPSEIAYFLNRVLCNLIHADLKNYWMTHSIRIELDERASKGS